MRRAGLLLIVLAACGGGARSSGPDWPKSAGHVPPDTWEEDGGESLAPRREEFGAVESGKEPSAPAPAIVVDPVPDPQLPPAPPVDYDFTKDEQIIIDGEQP